MNTKNLTLNQKVLWERVKRGAFPAINVEGDYFMSDGSKKPDGRTVRSLVKREILAPSNDGLLDGFTQTFRLAS